MIQIQSDIYNEPLLLEPSLRFDRLVHCEGRSQSALLLLAKGRSRANSLSAQHSLIDLYLIPSSLAALSPTEMLTFLGSLASLTAPSLPLGTPSVCEAGALAWIQSANSWTQ